MISCTVSAVAATADHRVVLPLEELVFKQLRRSKTKNQTEQIPKQRNRPVHHRQESRNRFYVLRALGGDFYKQYWSIAKHVDY